MDHIVYNLEHVNIVKLLNAIFDDIDISENTVITYSSNFGKLAFGRIDKNTRDLTWRSRNSFYPNTVTVDAVKQGKSPREIYFIAFPTTGDNEKYLSELLNFYDIKKVSKYEHLGYELAVLHLIQRI